jgi:cbb3-type cytochrome oxidase maturation protein
MSVLLVMIPITFLIAGGFVWAFIRAARRGEFDDLDAPPMRAVFDEDEHVAAREPD